jgi:hypothetical protein
MRVSLVLLVFFSCFLLCTATIAIPACPTPSTTSIRCHTGTNIVNTPDGGLCRCKCTSRSGYIYSNDDDNYPTIDGDTFSALGLTSAGCTSASCALNLGLQSVCSKAFSRQYDPYVNFTPTFIPNSVAYSIENSYGGVYYATSPPLGAGTICVVTLYTCTAAMANANYCEDSMVGGSYTFHSFFNASSTEFIGSSYGTIVGATAACEAFRKVYAAAPNLQALDGATLFCSTDSCNNKDVVWSSSSLVKPASLVLVIVLMVATFL